MVILFQSTRPRGARRQRPADNRERETVSIHAPARGATVSYDTLEQLYGFQSTRPRGARPQAVGADAVNRAFQSTRPRGARRALKRIPKTWTRFNPRARAGRDDTRDARKPGSQSFNPRARAGRDWVDSKAIRSRLVSIHAPARGATRQRAHVLPVAAVSIHAPARGATNQIKWLHLVDVVSIHAPARGATIAVREAAVAKVFQSTRPRGARRAADGGEPGSQRVSIHAPARGATTNSGPSFST